MRNRETTGFILLPLLILFLMMLLVSVAFIPGQQSAEAQTKYRWITLPQMPTPRTEVTSAVIGDDLYIIGGVQQGQVTSDKVEIFNIVNRTWRNGPSLPVALHHTVAVTYQDAIYLLGGYLTGWVPVNTTYIYDPAVGDWRHGPTMLTAKAAFTAQVIGNHIYTIGGATTIVVGDHIVQQVLNNNEYYDMPSSAWLTATPLPTPREHIASVQVSGKIYVIGGRQLTLDTNSNINEEYDPNTDTWAEKQVMPTARGGIAAAAVDAKIYVFGGEAATGTYNTTEMYDISTNTWMKIDPMPTARHGLTAQPVRGGILVVGGGPQPGFTYSGANELLDPGSTEEPASAVASSDTKLNLGNIGILIMLGAVGIILMVASTLFYLIRRTD
jgi:N-acetylneuraminic acid mutarotase